MASFFPFMRRESLHNLIKSLSPRALLPLALAICFLFSMVGVLTDLFDGAREPAGFVAANAAFGGLISIAYAYGGLRRRRLVLGAAFGLHVAYMIGIRAAIAGHSKLPLDQAPARLTHDATWLLIALVVSYSCFLWFINGTAASYLQARAEIELARQIHQVLVPPIAATVGEFEFLGFSAASGEVGGDLVDVVNRDGTWLGYVADVSGWACSRARGTCACCTPGRCRRCCRTSTACSCRSRAAACS
jgi:hypothetical protein